MVPSALEISLLTGQYCCDILDHHELLFVGFIIGLEALNTLCFSSHAIHLIFVKYGILFRSHRLVWCFPILPLTCRAERISVVIRRKSGAKRKKTVISNSTDLL
ncbi:hypothetical protein NPIL_423541 [Nephila pilipes]|uniref:Uncharacterized protein n=1 Tax=Nephila pilipes TaxID=299642 RepID=A0A8X6QYD5_NEPPI|nr:hypothetical protein NPIL_423541 [Nephila pilipes]